MQDKIKKVQNGLACCGSHHSCVGCPYDDIEDCSGQLRRDAIDVIYALKTELDRVKETANDILKLLKGEEE